MTSLSGLPYTTSLYFHSTCHFYCHNFSHIAVIFTYIFFLFWFQTFSESWLGWSPFIFKNLPCCILCSSLLLLLGRASTPEVCYPLWLDCDHLHNSSQFIILYFWVSDCLSNRLICCLYCQHLPRTQTFIMYFRNIS